LPQYNKLLTFKSKNAPEYSALLTTYNTTRANNVTRTPTPVPSVSTIDWVADGAAWPTAYDQLSCGGGYAFASVGALQGAYELEFNTAKRLSVSQVLTCSGISGNGGCTTGTPEATFNYWKTTAALLATVFN